MMAPHLAELALRLGSVATETEALSALDDWQRTLDADTDIEGALWRANAQTNLAGQLFVRDIELKRAIVSLDRAPPSTFLNLRFEDAIELFASRRLLSSTAFGALLDAERFRAFTMKNAITAKIIERAAARIRAALEPQGPGLRSFIADLASSTSADSYSGGVRRYLEMVYRTGTATSYNAGRFRQQIELGSDESLVWEYLTVGDNRVRASHAALNGKQWTVGDPEGRRVYPPNSFQCRCVIRVIEREDANAQQLSRTIDPDEAVTDGFNGDPAGAIDDAA